MSVSLDGVPVKGVPVIWKGSRFLNNNTLTDSGGIAYNEFLVVEGDNKVEAAINAGGGKYLSVSRTIQGVQGQYNLVISSNSPAVISGQGLYSYGDVVNLSAPVTVPMQGPLGLLGGKYVFVKWSGALDSTNSEDSLQISGLQPNISVNAEYTPDYLMLIVSCVVIGVAGVGGFIYYKRFRKPKISSAPETGDAEASIEHGDGEEVKADEPLPIVENSRDKTSGDPLDSPPTVDSEKRQGPTGAQIKAEIVKSKGISAYKSSRTANYTKKTSESKPAEQSLKVPEKGESVHDGKPQSKVIEGPIMPKEGEVKHLESLRESALTSEDEPIKEEQVSSSDKMDDGSALTSEDEPIKEEQVSSSDKMDDGSALTSEDEPIKEEQVSSSDKMDDGS
jgi:hypothetical protein